MAKETNRIKRDLAPTSTQEERALLLIKAAKRANLARVRELLASDPEPDRTVMREALCEAVLAQDPGVVGELLAHGADPHLAGECDVTALALAVQKPSVAIVKRLLKGCVPPTRKLTCGTLILRAAIADQWQHVPLLHPYAAKKDIAWTEHLREEAEAKTKRGKSVGGSLVIHHWTGMKEFSVSDGAYFVGSGKISICVQGEPKRKGQWPQEATLLLRDYPLPGRRIQAGDVYRLEEEGKAKPDGAPEASAYFGEYAWGIDMAFRVVGIRRGIVSFEMDTTCDDVEFYDHRAKRNRITGRIRLGPATGKEPWLQKPERYEPASSKPRRKRAKR